MYSINRKMNNVCKALGYKTRTDILYEIQKEGDLTLSELSKRFRMKKETLRFHVDKLKQSQLILSKKKGKYVFLHINNSLFSEVFQVFKLFFFEK